MTDQTFTVQSSDPVTAKTSSSATSTQVMGAVCPFRLTEKSQMSRFHNLATQSFEPQIKFEGKIVVSGMRKKNRKRRLQN